MADLIHLMSPLYLPCRIIYRRAWGRVQSASRDLFSAVEAEQRAELLEVISDSYARMARVHRSARPRWSFPLTAIDLSGSAILAGLAAFSETGCWISESEYGPEEAAAWEELASTACHLGRCRLLTELARLAETRHGYWAAGTLRTIAAAEGAVYLGSGAP